MKTRYFDSNNEQIFAVIFFNNYFCAEFAQEIGLDKYPGTVLLTRDDLLNEYIGPQHRRDFRCPHCDRFLPRTVEKEWYEVIE